MWWKVGEQDHEDQIWHCFCRLLRKAATSLPVAAGGLVLRSEFRLQEAAQWTSCADTMKMVRVRDPEDAETIMQAMEARDEVPSVQAMESTSSLETVSLGS